MHVGVAECAIEEVVLQGEVGRGAVANLSVFEPEEFPVEIVAVDELYKLIGIEFVGVGHHEPAKGVYADVGLVIVLKAIAGKQLAERQR